MIIDVHAHVFAFPVIKGKGTDTTFMSMEEQIALMNAKGVDKAIILPLNNPETPTEHQSIGEVLYICKKYPGRFIPFCNVDPRLPLRPDLIKIEDVSFILEQCKEAGCKGLGEVTARVYWDDPAVLLLLEGCEKVGFPVTFHSITAEANCYGLIDEIGLPRLEKVLARFPNLKLFGHSPGFWSEISGEVTPKEKNGYPETPVKPGGRIKELLRRYPGLYGDLSAGSGLNALTRDPAHAYEFIEEFQDRLMLGLDYCSVKNDMRHIEWFKAERDAGHISAAAYEKIMWKNINQAIHLGL